MLHHMYMLFSRLSGDFSAGYWLLGAGNFGRSGPLGRENVQGGSVGVQSVCPRASWCVRFRRSVRQTVNNPPASTCNEGITILATRAHAYSTHCQQGEFVGCYRCNRGNHVQVQGHFQGTNNSENSSGRLSARLAQMRQKQTRP